MGGVESWLVAHRVLQSRLSWGREGGSPLVIVSRQNCRREGRRQTEEDAALRSRSDRHGGDRKEEEREGRLWWLR